MSDAIERELERLSPKEKRFLWKKPFKVYKNVGCKFCGNKGTRGRIAIYEMLIMTPQLEKIIIEKELSDATLNEESNRQGVITMRQDGLYKALQGLISFEEVVRVADE